MRRDDDRDDPKRDASCWPSDASVSHAEARALCGTVVPTASRAGSEEQHDERASPIGRHIVVAAAAVARVTPSQLCCCLWVARAAMNVIVEREREDRDQCREQKSQRAHSFAASKKPVK